MNRVEVQKVPQKTISPLDGLAEFCYYFSQYTLDEARKLPETHVRRLLKKARQLEAVRYLNLTQIVAAPHSDKGKAVSQLQKHYEGIVRG